MSSAKQEVTKQLTKLGRTVTGVFDIDVSTGGTSMGTLVAFTGGKLSADRYEIITATGPFGPECIVIPFSGHAVLPGEYHLTLVGALRSPVEFLRRRGGTWNVGDDQELATWLKSQKFPTYMLPDELQQGLTKVKIEQMFQLAPIGPQHSALVFTLGGNHTQIDLRPYLELASKLAPAIAASVAPGPLAPLGEIRYGALVSAAHSGQLVTQPTPTQPIPGSPNASTPGTPADVAAQLSDALTPLLDKRVLLAPIDDKTIANIVKKVAKDTSPASVIAFLDNGVRASGKAGWAFTSDRLHISQIGDSWEIPYTSIQSFVAQKNKVIITSQLTGAVDADAVSIIDAAIPALVAVTGLSAT